jgi:hypothetical protein
MPTKYSYVGKYADGGSQNSFYKVKGKGYGFKGFPNKSLATFAHAVQSRLAPLSAPKVHSPVCRIRVPNYFVKQNKKGEMIAVTEMVLSDWGYLTEIAKPYRCPSSIDCYGDCGHCTDCGNYYLVQDLLSDMEDNGILYTDAHTKNLGYVTRDNDKLLVAIDFGRESLTPINEKDWPEVCWDGAEEAYCNCEACCGQYEEPEYV